MILAEEHPDVEQYACLFETTGWNETYRLSAGDLARTLENSQMVACAYDGERLVGFGRIVTDGIQHAMIYDLIVQPEYQGAGIGTLLLDNLVRRCRESGIRDIQLFCARGKRQFYEKRGFVARPEDAPGMQYRSEA